MRVAQVCSDWLTLTTFEYDDMVAFHESQYKSPTDSDPEQWSVRGYEGRRFVTEQGTAFLGRGVQKNTDHFRYDISGALSDKLLPSVRGVGRCTRIDIQLTLPEHKLYNGLRFESRLLAADWVKKGATPSISSANSDGDMTTVYIGGKKSDIRHRWYVKLDADSLRHVRFEVQFRGDKAHDIWDTLRAFPEKPIEEILFLYLKGQWDRLPDSERLWVGLTPFRRFFKGGDSLITPTNKKTNGRTVEWFLSAVVPVTRRLCNDHSVRDMIRRTLWTILDESGGVESAAPLKRPEPAYAYPDRVSGRAAQFESRDFGDGHIVPLGKESDAAYLRHLLRQGDLDL